MYNIKYHTEDISKYSFLITGGAGFIGSNIVEYLLKFGAKKVVVFDNLATGFADNLKEFLGNPSFQFIQGDICNYEACVKAVEGIDYVLHQAALGSVPRSIKNPVATNAVNIGGFVNIAFAAKEANVRRMVYASSSSVYGDSKQLPKIESVIGAPLSPYAVTKLADELYAKVFKDVYGMEIIGLRYFNVFGPKQSPTGEYAAAIPLFLNALKNNESANINGDGEQTRDFTFVENAVQANIKACFSTDKNAIGSVYNIAVGERISINQLYTILKNTIGSNVNPNYREARIGDVRDSLADITNAQKELGYQPQIRVEDGLKKTVEWFYKNI
ncbi:MAG: SDR family oxidoreductase [Bacteroidetes bacterium]|nr:SDR family oxidoreductase [Bacteroidota bacterium]